MKTFADFGIELRPDATGEVDVVCPQCSASRKKKNTRCLSVNTEKGTWLCHHCGRFGSLVSGWDGTRELHWRKPTYVRPEARLASDDLDVALVQFFAARGIKATTLRRNRVSLQRVYMPQVEAHVRAICFPYYRDGEYINAKFRDRHKNFRMEAGAERVLYGLDDIDVKRCVIVEGEIDKLSMEEAGITSCVSVPDGAPAVDAKHYDSKFTFLDEPKARAVEQWVIAVDDDPPGAKLERELARRFGVDKCKRVTWPQGCKDANDVLVQHGPKQLREHVESAKEFPIVGVKYANELARELELLYAQGELRGVSTGWPGFDRYFTVRPGELTVITGIPGHGKSNWVDALVVNLARNQRWTTGMFSPENQPMERHVSRLIEKFARQPFRDGPTPRMSIEAMREAREWVDFYFPMILPDDDADWTLDKILDIAARLVRRHGMRGLVIDPWNELEILRPRELTETEYTGRCLKRMRQFARHHDVHVFLVAHPAKLYRNKDGKYPVPSLYDIAGSANFRNKPDNGIVVWRDMNEPGSPVDVHVQKIRDRTVGEVGGMAFRYDPVIADYHELSSPVRDAWTPPCEYAGEEA